MSDNKTDRASGKVKEAAGEATNNRDLAAKGRREQIKGDVKKSGEKLKDAAKKM
ncbi:MAG TPA: CsbD family protein [Gaiellaceae bacterium]|nr:CsbD family protein [Gaiellaceae bacterium]